jgi:predicted ATP-grasp superfamily ATP-dependent carboligase
MEPADLPAAVAAAGPSFAVQQYTPDARVVSFAGVASRDGLLAVAFSRYERTWPPEAGSVTASVTAVPPPDLLASIEALLARIGWEGIFELELLEHPDGGRSVIDFNPRVYGSMTLAIDAGANLPAVWVQHVLGGKQAPIAARAGLRYRWEEGEARTAGRLVSEHRYAEAGRLLRTPSPRVWAFFRASDPMPAVVRASWLLARPLRRGLERIRSTGDEAARPPAPGDGASTATPSEPAPPCDGAGCERPRSLLLQRRAADGRLLEAGFCDRHTFDVAVQTAVFASRRTPGVEASGS